MKSELEPFIGDLQEWAHEEGITFELMAQRLRDLGIQTTEASVRRAFKRHRITKPTDHQQTKAERASTHVERAFREVQGVRTAEDKLRDQLDLVTKDYKEAEAVIRKLREQKQVEDRVVDAIYRALDRKADELHIPVLSKPKPGGNSTRGHEFLLMMSDAHYGELVNPEEALGIKYDTDICRRRIQHMRDVTFRYADLRETSYPINKITVAILGDMLSGNIHEELAITNQITMVDQMVDMAHILFNFAGDLSEKFPDVELIVLPGNHPRPHKKPRFKGRYENWEFAMGKMVEGMADYGLPDHVTVTVPKDMVYIHDIFDSRIAMVHGDGVKSNSFAGIPFYGMRNQREAIQALMSLTGQDRVDYFLMGHFHQHLYWAGECTVVINGAIKGGDEYGIGTRLSAPEPTQVLLEFHPEHGLTAQDIISLGHIE